MAKRTQTRMNARQARRDRRASRRGHQSLGPITSPASDTRIVEFPGQHKHQKKVITFTPKNVAQSQYYDSIMTNVLTFGFGSAGTGKSFVAATAACKLLMEGKIERIIVTRPALGAEEELGFFKGDMDEKLAPWVAPIRAILDRHLGRSYVDYLVKEERISFQPFATMRGHDWPNTFILVDEAQNTTPNQMKLVLTRTGENSVIVIDGDIGQKDIREFSGLEDALSRLGKKPSVGHIQFGIEDVVRSGFVKMVLEAYE